MPPGFKVARGIERLAKDSVAAWAPDRCANRGVQDPPGPTDDAGRRGVGDGAWLVRAGLMRGRRHVIPQSHSSAKSGFVKLHWVLVVRRLDTRTDVL
jgi:hypothetical protein